MYLLTNTRKNWATKTVTTLFMKRSFNKKYQQLLEWTASLPSQTETEQIASIKSVLLEIAELELPDEQSIALMNLVVTTVEHLVASLHTQYIHQSTGLSSEQHRQVKQVEYLYYLVIVAYDGMLRRQVLLRKKQAKLANSKWRQWLASTKKSSAVLAAILYQTMLFYQKLSQEQRFTEQSPSYSLWHVLNQIYLLAYEQNLTHLDLSELVNTRKANNIHELYLQSCLYSLLNIAALPRTNLRLVHQLLPTWASYLTTTESLSNSRIFVNLQSHNPPEYLDANTTINPYEAGYQCLFIDLAPLASYLGECKLALSEKDSFGTEYRLLDRLLESLNYRYLQRQKFLPSKRSPRQNANIISKYHRIHDHIVGETGLQETLKVKSTSLKHSSTDKTSVDYQNLLLKKTDDMEAMTISTFDSTDIISHFRVCHLSSTTNNKILHDKKNATKKVKSDNIKQAERSLFDSNLFSDGLFLDTLAATHSALQQDIKTLSTSANSTKIAGPPLFVDSLLLLNRPNTSGRLQRSIGLVRWLHFKELETVVEWQVLGHQLNACTLRLDNSNAHSFHDVSSIMVAADADLQTKATLLVPPYHFQSHNRVILNIGELEKSLHLQRCLLSTNEFSQFEFAYIND